MASVQQLKRRISSVSNTKQITKAMELVAASKMRRAQEAASLSRDFRNTAREILTRIAELIDVNRHPLYTIRKLKTRLIIVVTSDRGLAGAYNSNVLKAFAKELTHDEEQAVATQVIVIGKQAARFASRLLNVNVIGVYENFAEQPTANDIRPILTTITDLYTKQTVDAVDIIYTNYLSSIRQELTIDRLLPAAFEAVRISDDVQQAEFEPSPRVVLESVTQRLIEAQLNQALLESQASEQSMRMMAMKNASDNASDIIDDLTIAFNTARQAGITQEIAEITGGAEAIK